MTQEQALHLYMSEVLGITSVLRPVGEAPSSEQPQVFERIGSAPTVLLWVSERPQGEARTLIERMMSAAKISSYLIFWGEAASDETSKAFLSQFRLSGGIQFLGKSPLGGDVDFSGLKLVSSVSLASMLEGEPAAIQQNKKVVWAQIQRLGGN